MPAIDLAAIYDTGYRNTDNITKASPWGFTVTGVVPNSVYAISAFTPSGRHDAFYTSTMNGDFTFSVNPGSTAGSYKFLLFSQTNPNAEATLTVKYDLTAPKPTLKPSTLLAEDKPYVDFTVTFGEPVVGVDPSDFVLKKTGVSAAIIARSLISPGVWRVRVDTGNAGQDGYITLSIPSGAVIADIAGNRAVVPATSSRVRVINYNHMDGGTGPDVMQATPMMDMVDGKAGKDTVSYSKAPAAVAVDLATGRGKGSHAEGDRYLSMENATGSNYNDILRGSKIANVLKGGPGNDTISGGEGGDTIQGGPGSNKLDGGPGADTYLFTARTDFRIVPRATTAAALATLPPPTTVTLPAGDKIVLPADADSTIPGNQLVTLSDNGGTAPPDVGQIQIQQVPNQTASWIATMRIVPQELLQVMMIKTLIVPRIPPGENALVGQ